MIFYLETIIALDQSIFTPSMSRTPFEEKFNMEAVRLQIFIRKKYVNFDDRYILKLWLLYTSFGCPPCPLFLANFYPMWKVSIYFNISGQLKLSS